MNDIIYPPCKYCGKSHGMGIEDMETGIITPIDICKKCLWKDYKPIMNSHFNIENISEEQS